MLERSKLVIAPPVKPAVALVLPVDEVMFPVLAQFVVLPASVNEPPVPALVGPTFWLGNDTDDVVVNEPEPPAQTVISDPTGLALTVIACEVVFVQPFASVTVTVYVPVDVKVFAADVVELPAFHK